MRGQARPGPASAEADGVGPVGPQLDERDLRRGDPDFLALGYILIAGQGG